MALILNKFVSLDLVFKNTGRRYGRSRTRGVFSTIRVVNCYVYIYHIFRVATLFPDMLMLGLKCKVNYEILKDGYLENFTDKYLKQ